MGKTRLLIRATVLLSGILLTGCGADTPEDVAKTFANALSKANLKEANSISSEIVQKKIIKLKVICQKSMIKDLEDEALVVLNSIRKKSESDKKYELILIEATTKIRKVRESFSPKLSQLQKKYAILAKKYSVEADPYNPFPVPKIPKEILKKHNETKVGILREKAKKVLPIINDFFEAFDIKTEDSNRVKKVIADFTSRASHFYGERIFLSGAVKNVVRDESINQKCVAKYTDFGFIERINIIETIKDSPDKASVRLELITKDGKSKKVSVNVEKIKDEWKVSSLSLDMW